MARPTPFVKLAVGLVAIGGLAYLFLRSVSDTRSEPYLVPAAHLAGWTLAIEESASQPTSPVLVLQPPREFAGEWFRQVFARAMESMKGSSSAAVPIVLQGEFELALAASSTPATLLSAAREAGLETATFTPRCLAVRRISEPGGTRQVYFVIFEAPAFERFRERIAIESQAADAPNPINPAALSPVMIIGATDANLNRWLPIAARPDTDCVAPIVVN